ncbi:MAG: serine/threonine protein kinase [Lentisphaerae bacterium]|nr:serine/threonine protein kinase [Lentisphaerota bacterium]
MELERQDSADASAARGSERLGPYRIVRIIGKGGEGIVYEAVREDSGTPSIPHGAIVALKLLYATLDGAENEHRFHRHIKILQRLSHPAIVRYLEDFASELPRHPCIVMDFVENRSLRDVIACDEAGQNGTEIPWAQGREIFRQCLEGLCHARSRHVHHLDIKPSNILILKDGSARLIDFGIARLDDETTADRTPGGIKGTPDFMAPEFAEERDDENWHGDERSDIFSFGACLYVALCGRLPFPPSIKTISQHIRRWAGGRELPELKFPERVFNVLPRLRAFIRKCLDVDPEKRFQSFAEALAEYLQIDYFTLRQGPESYQLVEWIAAGGFGEVYKAIRGRDGALVAVKHLTAQRDPARFIREAKRLREISDAGGHPHVIRYLDFIAHSDVPGLEELYLVLEFLEGAPEDILNRRIRAAKPHGLPVDEVIRLFICYLRGLDHLHGQNMIHRDIKPANLYAPPLGASSEPKIFDLGIVREERDTIVTKIGPVPGTPEYMAPELLASEKVRGTVQSDIYALGVSMYEALGGQRPTAPPSPSPRVSPKAAWLNPAPAVVVNTDDVIFRAWPGLLQVLLKATHVDPRRRYKSASDMLAALSGLMVAQHTDVGTVTQSVPGKTKADGVTVVVPPPDPSNPLLTLVSRWAPKVVPWLLVACALVGIVNWSYGRWTLQRARATETFALKSPQLSPDYVSQLVQYRHYFGEQLAQHPGDAALERQIQTMESRTAALLGDMTNAMAVAAAKGGVTNVAQLVALWRTVPSDWLEPVRYATIETFAKQQTDWVAFRQAYLAATKNLPTRITEATLEQAEACVVDLSELQQQSWPPGIRTEATRTVAAKIAELSSNYVAFLNLSKIDSSTLALTNSVPVLHRLAGPAAATLLDGIRSQVDSTFQEQVLRRLMDELQPVQTTQALVKWFERNAQLASLAWTAEREQRFQTELANTVKRTLTHDIGIVTSACARAESLEASNFQPCDDFQEALDGLDPVLRLLPPSLRSCVQSSRALAKQASDEAKQRLNASALSARRDLAQVLDRVAAGGLNPPQLLSEVTTAEKALARISERANRASFQALVAAALTNAIGRIVGQDEPLLERGKRLKGVNDLLREPAVSALLGAEAMSGMIAGVNDQLGVCRLALHNEDANELTVNISGLGYERRLAAGSRIVVSVPVQKPGAGRVLASRYGYETKEQEFTLSPGGGCEIGLGSLAPKRLTIAIGGETVRALDPPVSIAYRLAGQGDFRPWAPELALPPGRYELRLSRPDYDNVDSNIVLKVGGTSPTLEFPPVWTPSPQLDALDRLQAALTSPNPGLLTRWIPDERQPKFEWQAHEERYRRLEALWVSKATDEVTKALLPIEAAIAGYRAALYQVMDPSSGELCAPPGRAPNLNLSRMPPWPDRAIARLDAATAARWRRAAVWTKYAVGDLPGRRELTQKLAQLAQNELSMRTELEFDRQLLAWDGATAPPPADTRMPESFRWRAHRTFRPGEPTFEVLDNLAQWVQRGGQPNNYDLQLAIYQAGLCLGNNILGVKEQKNKPPTKDGRIQPLDPVWAWEHSIRAHRDLTLRVLSDLKRIVDAAPDGAVQTTASLVAVEVRTASASSGRSDLSRPFRDASLALCILPGFERTALRETLVRSGLQTQLEMGTEYSDDRKILLALSAGFK